MKKIVLLCSVLLCFACKMEKDDYLIGRCDSPIELSQKNINISSEENTVRISINRESWWFDGVSLNDKNIELSEKDIEGNRERFKIKNKDFTIERIKPTEFMVTMKENKTGNDRTLWIGLQAGNCFSGVTIIQSSKK